LIKSRNETSNSMLEWPMIALYNNTQILLGSFQRRVFPGNRQHWYW